MNNNQNKTKLKASAVDFIGPLLKRLAEEIKVSKNSQMATTIDQIRTEVLKTKDSIGGIQKWDWELIGLFGKIERQIDSWIDHNEKRDEMKEITVMKKLHDILCKLSHISEKAPDLHEVGESSNRSYQGSKLFEDFKDLKELDVHSILCLYSLGSFPENTELEKRFVIYWWIGLGLLPRTSWKKAKMYGNKIYSGLKEKGFLESLHNGKQNQVINRCTINPTVHKWLLSPNVSNVIFSFDRSEHSSSPLFGEWFKERVHINLDKKYLNVDNVPINKELQVVHLGSWRYTEVKADNNANETGLKETMSIDHIEIENPDVLKKLCEKGQKTTYLISLRGISGIEEIPESIGKLENLMILDLRSCHNLIKLPQQPRSTLRKKLSHHTRFNKLIGWALPQESWFNKLMVLDISGCFLLDHMPKWISELCNLEVLKGFLVGRVGKKKESCQLGDLSKLINLKKLSIRTTTDMSPEVFSGFKSLESLLILTITWGKHKIPDYSLPKNLEKLDIRCYPEDDVSMLKNCDELTELKKLYIRGGNLRKIPSHNNWKVEKLRLRFLKNLVSTDWEEVRGLFSNLNYVEYVGCPRPDKFPNDGSCWIKEKADNNQNEAKLKASVEGFIGPLNIQKTPYITKIEPFGSLGGSVQEMDPAGITRIVKISIYHSEVIDSLAICFERNGLTQCTNRWGGDGGNITEINLKTDEYIETVEGFFNDNYNGHEVVMSLTLKTNLAEYGPYGTKKGKYFNLRGPDYSKIIGFHAHCEKYINAVGVYVQSTGGSTIKKGGFPHANMQEKEMDPTGITRIVKIIIYHGFSIYGLIVDFERNDTTQCTYRWGGNWSGSSTSEVNFETKEYITSVNGHMKSDHNAICFVTSLVLKTNLRVYGPYGMDWRYNWTPFKFSAPLGGQIIGFHAYHTNNRINFPYVHALGVYVRQLDGTVIKEWPFLGDGGIVKCMDPTCITRIVKISIYHGDKINGLTVYFERNGTTQCTGLWGKNKGTLDEINFKTKEYIKFVKGYREYGILRSLELVTNLDIYGPYGTEKGQSFEHTSLHGQIISFFACVGINCVFRLGVHIQPLPPKSKSVLCGGSGGSARDMDDVSAISNIRGVKIRYDDTIHALSVRYKLNDFSLKETPLWGGETGKLTEIDFDKYEYIKSVRGYVSYFGDIFTVRSLELITNKTTIYGGEEEVTYGPYGKEEGTPFELSAFGGEIIGFHGRSGEYLNAIGVYVQWP